MSDRYIPYYARQYGEIPKGKTKLNYNERCKWDIFISKDRKIEGVIHLRNC